MAIPFWFLSMYIPPIMNQKNNNSSWVNKIKHRGSRDISACKENIILEKWDYSPINWKTEFLVTSFAVTPCLFTTKLIYIYIHLYDE